MQVHLKQALIVMLLIAVGISWTTPRAIPQAAGVPTITTVVLLNHPIPGRPVTLTGMVISAEPSAGVPSGTVEFFNGPDSLGTAILENNAGVGMGSLTVELPAGSYSIYAAYSGDYAFALSASNPSIPLQVLE